jgi:hypothetical protein
LEFRKLGLESAKLDGLTRPSPARFREVAVTTPSNSSNTDSNDPSSNAVLQLRWRAAEVFQHLRHRGRRRERYLKLAGLLVVAVLALFLSLY